MKKFLVLAAVVLGLGLSSANAQEGKVYIGTTGVSFGTNTGDLMTGFKTGNGNTDWGIAPEVGYYISNDVALGLGIGYSSIKDKDCFGVNPYIRWFAHKAGAFSFYVQGGIEYFDNDDSNRFGVNVKPGIAYGLSDHFGINASFGSLGYEKEKKKDGTFGLDIEMSTLSFGLSYIF